MKERILITGGAGFIGSHLVDILFKEKECEIIVFDSLEEQVHGKRKDPPHYLNEKAEFVHGSVNDYNKLEELIKRSDIIFHLAAKVGVGQSMYQVKDYIESNILGTANLLDILANSEHDIKKLIIASSNTIYGEGKYRCKNCGIVFPKLRTINQLKTKDWELNCPKCSKKVEPVLSDESTPFNPSSIYGFSKQAQEQSSKLIGDTYGINTSILRFFLVYGSRQALSNPYTGVCTIFAMRLLNGKPPIIFEDGYQSRDFVNVKDICQALILAMEKNAANGEIFNVGTGIPITIKEVAEILSEKLNPDLKPINNHQYRVGDIRHCIADISKIKAKLGYKPTIQFKEGVDEVLNWIQKSANIFQDKSTKAINILKEKGLLK